MGKQIKESGWMIFPEMRAARNPPIFLKTITVIRDDSFDKWKL
jgi:hypothetical protein